MTRTPTIPMRPEELPQQRIAQVVSLPPRPAGFQGEEEEPPESAFPPPRMPRSAKYLGQFEWAWGPNNTLLAAYYLSTNRKRSHWFVWARAYDDDWGWLDPLIYAYGPKQLVPGKVAAAYLLLDAWMRQQRESEIGQFHWINSAGFLSVEELLAVARIVWPKPTGAPESHEQEGS